MTDLPQDKKKKKIELSGEKTKVIFNKDIKIKDVVFEDEDTAKFTVDPNSLPIPKSEAEAEGYSKQWFNKATSESDPERKAAYLGVSKRYLGLAAKLGSEKSLGDTQKKKED